MQNLFDPAILFFLLGALAGLLKSNLEIPPQISRFLSLYLLMALGLKGGFALAHSGFTPQVVLTLSCAVGIALVIPLVAFPLLKRLTTPYNAAALAATYGSVSAVTFITAVQYAENHGIVYGGHMAAAMALMESPAIIMAVAFANQLRHSGGLAGRAPGESRLPGHSSSEPHSTTSFGKILHESFTDGAQLLLLGALAIGWLTGEPGKVAMKPFSGDLFKGMLAFFLLDIGLVASRNFPTKAPPSIWVFVYAIAGPLCHAALALGIAYLCGLSAGDGGLLMVLAASASYIAVPAVLRHAIPEAQPSVYFGMALGITFPLNILLGVPFYLETARLLLR